MIALIINCTFSSPRDFLNSELYEGETLSNFGIDDDRAPLEVKMFVRPFHRRYFRSKMSGRSGSHYLGDDGRSPADGSFIVAINSIPKQQVVLIMKCCRTSCSEMISLKGDQDVGNN